MSPKGFRRLAAAVLAVILFINLLPAPASAEEPGAAEIKDQITAIYKKARSRSGKSSFSGFCASLVNWQTYLLGIDSGLRRCDGKNEYNIRSAEEKTASGYYTRCFSDADYSLEQALNAITINGTRNAYNMVVGFQSTKTSAGKRYGHTCFIHAIIDGVVYFVESDPLRIGGRYYASGKVITATIAEFASDYNSWTDFEGIVEYIKDPYETLCESYSTDIYVQITEQTPLRTEPCDFAAENIGETIRTIRSGEIFEIACILRNPEGEYWYKAADGAYFKANAAAFLSGQFDSVRIQDASAPAVLAKGEGFQIGGVVSTGGSTVSVLRGQIYCGASGTGVLIRNVTQSMSGNSVSLSGGGISQSLDFGALDQGTYHFVLSAVVYNRYVADGEMKCQWQTVDLWTADFVVTDTPENYVVAALDLQGGEEAAQQVVLARGEGLEHCVEPTRPGYSFDGWATEENAVSESGGIEENTTLYACWSLWEEVLNGWRWVDGTWRFYRRGVQCAGWMEVCGIPYYFGEDGPLEQGWLELDGQYFYLYENGSAAVGTVVLEGVSYTFDENGVLQQPETENADAAE